jgi:hypothetical protein
MNSSMRSKFNGILNTIVISYIAFVALCLFSQNIFVASILICCVLVIIGALVFPKTDKMDQRAIKIRHCLFVVCFFLSCKPYQIPVSLRLVKSIDEGEGYITAYYDVSYHAPESPTVLLRVDNYDSKRVVSGWVRYSPLDFLFVNHQRVLKIKNLPKGEPVQVSRDRK